MSNPATCSRVYAWHLIRDCRRIECQHSGYVSSGGAAVVPHADDDHATSAIGHGHKVLHQLTPLCLGPRVELFFELKVPRFALAFAGAR